MLARDIYPTRLERAKAELARFIDTLKGDRVGLVAFAGETMSLSAHHRLRGGQAVLARPRGPTTCRSAAPISGAPSPRRPSGSTHVRAREGKSGRRRSSSSSPTARTPKGRASPRRKKAAALGIKIYTLGIGSNDKPPVPLFDEDGKQHGYVTDETGEPVRVGLDEVALKQIAALTGGEYVPLDPQRFGVDRVQAAIAGLERTEEEARFEREPDDVGRWFLVPAFLLPGGSGVRARAPAAAARAGARAVGGSGGGGASEPSQRDAWRRWS